MYPLLASPIMPVTVQGKPYFIKRDDLSLLTDTDINGNKARKFAYYMYHECPNITTLISHGGTQSNAMRALALLAHHKKWTFIYYTRPISRTLSQCPVGNFQVALDYGMQLRPMSSWPDISETESTLIIPQGGHMPQAAWGIAQLAHEIHCFIDQHPHREWGVFLPSGTGTTALYLQKHLSIPVFTTPCIGDATYLRKQWEMLDKNSACYPSIYESTQRYYFGQTCPEHISRWRSLCQETGIVFDLLYDPHAWNIILTHRASLPKHLIYVHCGGIEGNHSMLLRYHYQQCHSNIPKMPNCS